MNKHNRLTITACAAIFILAIACSTSSKKEEAAAVQQATPATAATAGHKDVAASLVKAGMIKAGDKVLISGSARDAVLLEDIAIETMKAGGQPMITMNSETLDRRSFDEVPESFDAQAPTLGLAMANTFDVRIAVDYTGESENIMAGISAARVAARAKAGLPVTAATLKRGPRYVNLGNGLYPTASLSSRLGMPQSDLAATFWRAAAVDPQVIHAAGDAMRAALADGKQVKLSAANGTDLTFDVDLPHAFSSDGAITADAVKRGGAAPTTWLPAGELLIPVVIGSAEGKIVVDKLNFLGKDIVGLTLTFAKGKVTAMTATSGIEEFKARYDAGGANKDLFTYIDLGLNPEAKLSTGTGRIVWMAPGAITVGIGDNTGWGGSNVSDYGAALPLSGTTLSVAGKAVIDKGMPK